METIYSKRYDLSQAWMECEKDLEEKESFAENSETVMKKLIEEITFRPAENRICGSEKEIEFVKRFAEFSKMDIDIQKGESQVIFILYCKNVTWSGYLKRGLERLFHCCNEIQIETEKDGAYDYIISLHYFTHDVFLGDRKVVAAEEMG